MPKLNKREALNMKNKFAQQTVGELSEKAVNRGIGLFNRFLSGKETTLSVILKGKTKVKPALFVIMSLLIGVVFAVAYFYIFSGNFLVVLSGFVFGCMTLLSTKGAGWYIEYKTNQKIEYQSFLEMLQTEFAINTSLPVIFANIVDRDCPEDVKKVLQQAVLDLHLGKSVEDVLIQCERSVDDVILKNVFIALRVNYHVGSARINSCLEVFADDFRETVTQIIDLRDKINGHLADKLVFIVLALGMPIVIGVVQPGYFDSWLQVPFASVITIAILAMPFVGSMMIDNKLKSLLATL